jgi:hypothetical protein
MNSRFLKSLVVAAVVVSSNLIVTSCKSYCPAVDGTGNTASRGVRRTFGRTDCPAVAGTGNYKPKLKNKREDGLTSPKMARAMAKAEKKKAGPIVSKRLHFD